MKTSEKRYRKHWIIHWAVINLLLFSSHASAEFRHFSEWTKKEQSLFLAYHTVAYIDHRQTRVGLRNGYRETNPIYGQAHRDKSILINGIVAAGAYYLIGKNEPNHFNLTLAIGTAGRAAAVYHNDSIGVSWKVAF